jgi:DNA-binding NarL/FixJ family response regulator
VLNADVRASLSGVLVAASACRDARGLPLLGFLALARTLASETSLMIDFASVEQLGQPVVVLTVNDRTQPRRFDVLTAREREVARCVAAGLPNREIAARLWLTTATVKDHVHHILTKTGLPNRTALAAAWNGERSLRKAPA